MRVLLANKFFFRNGGSEVVMFQERDFLLSQGHEVIDFSMHDERNFESKYSNSFVGRQDYRNGNRIAKLLTALRFIHSSEAVSRISKLIRATRPDVLHCHNIYHQLTPSIIGAAKAHGLPVVLTLHDSKPVCPAYTRLRGEKPCSECLDGSFGHALRYRCADGSLGASALLYAEAVIQRRLGNYEKVDRYIAPSRFMADSVAHRIPDERVALLYNGVAIPSSSSNSNDGGYVLYLGRLSAEKGVETLLRAQAASNENWPLMIAGTGPLRDHLSAKYMRATFLGHLTGDALQRALMEASVVVVPSECYENCPMAVLEAMANGKPVIGSRLGGIPELIIEGETGLLFEPGNVTQLSTCLSRLMTDQELRRKLGANARLHVEAHFSIETHNRGLLGIYQSVLQ